jgi:hypothetical protein
MVLSIILLVVLTAFGCAPAGYYYGAPYGFQGTSEQYRDFQKFNKGSPESWQFH